MHGTQDVCLSSAVSASGRSQQAESLLADIEQPDTDDAPQPVSTTQADGSSDDEHEYDAGEHQPEPQTSGTSLSPPQAAGASAADDAEDEEDARAGIGARRSSRARSAVSYKETASDEEEEQSAQQDDDEAEDDDGEEEYDDTGQRDEQEDEEEEEEDAGEDEWGRRRSTRKRTQRTLTSIDSFSSSTRRRNSGGPQLRAGAATGRRGSRPVAASWESEYTQRPRRLSASSKRVNYRVDGSDDEDDEEEEEDERQDDDAEDEEQGDDERAVDEARQRQRQEAESDAFAIERVLDARQRADGSGDSEYLIQWHGDSHLYDSWHTVREAEALCESGRGLKKLSNFISREREAQQLRLSCSGEEAEQLNVQTEMMRQEREDWTKVEKIIASRQADTADVRRLQRIRQRRRTFRLQPAAALAEAEEEQQGQEEAEKQQQDSRTTREDGHEDAVMMVEVEEKQQQATAAISSSGSMEVEEKEAVVSTGVNSAAVAMDGTQQLAAGALSEAGVQSDAAEDAEDADEAAAAGGGQTVTQYLVKWRGLTHDECSWESAEDIAAFQSAIDDFLDLEHLTAALRSSPSSSHAGGARKFRELTAQPAYLSKQRGELREYQLEGLNWLIHNWCQGINGILADEMGLGKTIQCIAFLCHLFYDRQVRGPFLIIVPLSTITAWQREFSKWAPAMNVVGYVGNAKSRDIIRQYEWSRRGAGRRRQAAAGSDYRFHVVLSTYEFVMKDRAHLGSVRWLYLMIDEAHRLKDSRSQLYQTLFSFPAEHRLLITGTPLQNTLSELWSLLHFIHRERFPSLEQFQAQHASVRSGEMAGLSSLHSVLKPHLLRRTKKDVLRSLPAKREKILLVEMTPLQRRYSRWIIARNYRDLNKGVKGKKASLSNVIMELKKCCNHPFLTRPPGTDDDLAADTTDAAAMAGARSQQQQQEQQQQQPQSGAGSDGELDGLIRNSGKLILLDRLLRRLKQTGHRVLIFSQMVRMLDLLADYLRLRGFLYQRLDGGMRSQERQYAMDHFNAEGSADFCFILSTKAGGLGINLATADTVVIFDSDWNPQNDLQAEARAHRIGQRHAVNIYRLVTRGTVEEDILRRAKQKMILDHLVIQRMDTSGRSVVPSSAASASSASSALFSTPSSALFDNRELAKILQFGAEDLFADSKDDDDDGGSRRGLEDEMDIDDILLRADSRVDEGERAAGQEDGGTRPHQEQEDQTEAFLSAFKVASFRTGGKEEEEKEEEKQPAQAAEQDDDLQFWSRVIPSSMIPADQLQDDGAAAAVPLFLPPRQRRAVLSYNETKLREAAEEEHADSELSDDSEDDSRGAKAARRRGRKQRGRGAEDDDAATDGELSAKDVKQLYRHMLYFGDDERVLHELFASCWKHKRQHEQSRQRARAMIQTIMQAAEEAVRHPPAQQQEQDEAEKERDDGDADNADEEAKEAKRRRAKQKKLSIELMPSVLIHPAELLQRRRELRRLQQLIAAHSDPLKFRITNTRRAVPPVRWTRCIWRPKQDAMLMYGVALHGMNGWDAIVDDPQLRLKECIVYRRRKNAEQQTTEAQPADSSSNGSSGSNNNGAPAVPASASSPAASTGVAATADEMEEIRSVKNHQLAARAALLLRLMMPDDGNGNAKAAGGEKVGAVDKKKRGREEAHAEAQRGGAAAAAEQQGGGGGGGGRQREEQFEPAKRKKTRGAKSDGDRADEAQETAVTERSSIARHRQQQQGAKGDDAGRLSDKWERGAKEHKTRKADSGLHHQHDAAAVAANVAMSAAAEHRDGDGGSSGGRQRLRAREAASNQLKPASASPPAPQRRKLSGAASSASSVSLSSSGGRSAAEAAGGAERGEDEDDVLPELISWCKAQLASVNASLKELHHYAQAAGGFPAHREEVRPRLLAIGDECQRIVSSEKKGESVRQEVDRHLWHYVSIFTRMSGATLRKLYLALSRKRRLEPHSAH